MWIFAFGWQPCSSGLHVALSQYLLSFLKITDVAVETRIQIEWNKFRQLVPLLTNKDIIDSEREIVQQLCVKQYVAWK